MAQKLFSHKVEVTPGAQPQTQWQARIPTNGRALLHAIAFMPVGATSASAPIKWDLGIQSADGTLDTDDSANLVKEIPAYSGSILTTLHITPSVEPTTMTAHFWITLHQQAMFIWRPPTRNGFIIMDTGTRWGLRCLTSSPGFAIRYEFHMEE